MTCLRPNFVSNNSATAMTVSTLLFLYVTLLLHVHGNEAAAHGGGGGGGKDKARLEKVLLDTMTSLQKMVNFFEDDYSSINADGLFGIRTGQGSVNQTLASCRSGQLDCPLSFSRNLGALNEVIESVAERAMPYVEQQDPDYFHKFWSVVNGPYILRYRPEVIEDIPPVTHGDVIKYNEEMGDACFGLLIGGDDRQPKCTVTDDCWHMMTREGTDGYTITHQLLYFIFAEKAGCVPAVNTRLHRSGGRSLHSQQKRMCSRILAEAKQEVVGGHVVAMKQDLFLEQCLLCGIIGFENFLTEDWASMVLSWQNDMGCFAMSPSLVDLESEIVQLQAEQRRLLSTMRQEADHIEHQPAGRTGRKLLREQIMQGNCLAHKTGLAFGLVGAYIRYFATSLFATSDFNHGQQ